MKMDTNYITSSVDPEEVQFFKTFANDWWDEKGDIRLLHTFNELRVPWVNNELLNTGISKREYLNQKLPLQGVKILDAGCGGGLFSEPLAKLGAEVTGVDPTEELIKVATYHASLSSDIISIKFIQETVEEHAEKYAGYYDCVVSSEVLEHITEQETYLEACAKCLKPGGSIFATTLNKTYWAQVLAVWIAEYVLQLLPKGTHSYDKFISPEDVTGILKKYKCTTISTRGMMVNPLTWKWFWFPSSFVHYGIHAIKQ